MLPLLVYFYDLNDVDVVFPGSNGPTMLINNMQKFEPIFLPRDSILDITPFFNLIRYRKIKTWQH